MLTLFCVVVGDGSPFPVEMDADQSVGDLKDKIKTKNPNSFHCVAKDLDLYVAFKDNAWLESTNPLALQLIEGDTPYEMQKYLVKGMKMNPFSSLAEALPAPPGQDQLHILVVVPKSAVSAATLRTTCDLLQVILPHVLMGSRNTISDRNSNFKANLCSFYDCRRQQKRWIRCLVLDILFPASLVAATHLIRNTYLAFPMMQISDIDDVRNGLLLFQPLKDAFDHCHISFIYDKRDDSFYLKLFDPSIRNTPLIDFMRDPKQRQVLMDAISIAKEPCRYDPQTTFGDLEGQALKFTSLNRPYNRCLNVQARLAHGTALKKQDIDPSYNFDDFWSEGFSLEDKMTIFRQSFEDCDHV